MKAYHNIPHLSEEIPNYVEDTQTQDLLGILPRTEQDLKDEMDLIARQRMIMDAINKRKLEGFTPTFTEFIDRKFYLNTGVNCKSIRDRFGIKLEDFKQTIDYTNDELHEMLNTILVSSNDNEIYKLIDRKKLEDYVKYKIDIMRRTLNVNTRMADYSRELLKTKNNNRLLQGQPIEYSDFGKEEIETQNHEHIRAAAKMAAYDSVFKKMGI